jgi:hypothetical protein
MYLRIKNDCIECQVCGKIPNSIFADREGNQKCCLCLDDNEYIYVKNYILSGFTEKTKIYANSISIKEFKKQDIDWSSHLS